MKPFRITRRFFAAGIFGSAASGAYAGVVEPGLRLVTTTYRPTLRGWPGPAPRIAALADLHAGAPYMKLSRIEAIIAATNALQPDLVVLLGDFCASHRLVTAPVPIADIARAHAALRAPLGVFAIAGNHDWWDDHTAQRSRRGPPAMMRALGDAGIHVLTNQAVRLNHRGAAFWLAGLDDQLAFPLGRGRFKGCDDLPGTLARVTDNAPIILLAHEPNIFKRVPERVALTLCGHTHGGQVRILGYSPVTPSSSGNQYAYGHIVEHGRQMIVSGGLGCSIAPIRFGVPPEIVLVEPMAQTASERLA